MYVCCDDRNPFGLRSSEPGRAHRAGIHVDSGRSVDTAQPHGPASTLPTLSIDKNLCNYAGVVELALEA
jgi:hypothetical protein